MSIMSIFIMQDLLSSVEGTFLLVKLMLTRSVTMSDVSENEDLRFLLSEGGGCLWWCDECLSTHSPNRPGACEDDIDLRWYDAADAAEYDMAQRAASAARLDRLAESREAQPRIHDGKASRRRGNTSHVKVETSHGDAPSVRRLVKRQAIRAERRLGRQLIAAEV